MGGHYASGITLPKCEKRGLSLSIKRLNGIAMAAQQLGDVSRRAVPQANPHDFGWRPTKHAEAVKVLVLRYE